MPAPIARQGQANQPTRIARHEIYILGARELGAHDEIAFILTILIVHDDDHTAGAQVSKNLFD